MTHVWYRMWADGRALVDVPITWDVLRIAFLKRFFLREKKESKVEDLMNLRQGIMCIKEYSLKFVKLSKYASSIVANSMYKMRRFVTGVSEDLIEDCWAAMLHDIMDVCRLMVHECSASGGRSS